MNDTRSAMVVDGLLADTPDGPRLLGTRCRGCDTLYFPQASNCPNPTCHAKAVEPATLPGEGTLYSYTIQRYQPPPLFRMDDWQPYMLGLVDMGEGVRVMGMLMDVEERDVQIGMELRVVTGNLYKDEEGINIRTYKFAPLREPA